jgi:hypothetical protein
MFSHTDKVATNEDDDLLDAETSEVVQDSGSREKYEAAMNFVAKFRRKSKRRQKNDFSRRILSLPRMTNFTRQSTNKNVPLIISATI